MRVLVIGSGGREHALCWSIAASPLLTKLWCAPGNPGIAQVAECVPIGRAGFPALVAFAQDNEIDLVVPGPEAPLVAGIADAMEAAGRSRASGRRAPRRSLKAARRSPRNCATLPAFPPRNGSGSTMPRRRASSCAGVARRSW